MHRTVNSCGALNYFSDPGKQMQHKLLLLFETKKVIVAKIKLCGRSDDHNTASGYISCGHYTTGGGGMQGGKIITLLERQLIFSGRSGKVKQMFLKEDGDPNE